MKTLFAIGALAALSGLAQGGIFFEFESNDTIATANDLGSITDPGGSILVDGTITPGDPASDAAGDVDWFAISFNGTTDLVVSIFSLTDPANDDSMLMLVDGDGTTILAFDDDDGIEYMSSFQVFDLSAGTYYIGVSGYPDSDGTTLFDGYSQFDGSPITENFAYKLLIGANVVPAPAGVAMFGLAGLAGLRRRR